MLPQLAVERLPTALGNENDMVLQSHLLWLRLSQSSIVKLLLVCVVAHDWKSPRWATARKVKLLLPPRQSRGISLAISIPSSLVSLPRAIEPTLQHLQQTVGSERIIPKSNLASQRCKLKLLKG